MKGQLARWSVANAKSRYATCDDFCELFAANVERFYLLSLLLTADPEKAEQCFVAGLEDCVNGISVFHECLDCWARRAIVNRAIRLIQPRSGDAASGIRAFHPTEEGAVRGSASQNGPFARVLALENFERFAFVLSVLEGYPDRSCAVVLGTSRQEIREARVRGFDRLSGIGSPRLPWLSCSLSGVQPGLS